MRWTNWSLLARTFATDYSAVLHIQGGSPDDPRRSSNHRNHGGPPPPPQNIGYSGGGNPPHISEVNRIPVASMRMRMDDYAPPKPRRNEQGSVMIIFPEFGTYFSPALTI